MASFLMLISLVHSLCGCAGMLGWSIEFADGCVNRLGSVKTGSRGPFVAGTDGLFGDPIIESR